MKTVSTVAVWVIALILLAPVQAAFAACERLETEEGHIAIHQKCTLAAHAEWAETLKEIVTIPLKQTWPPSDLSAAIQLPNLRVTAIDNKWNPLDDAREIFVTVHNDGPADIRTPFVVRGALHIIDAYRTGLYQNGTIVTYPRVFETVNRLDAGDSVVITLYRRIYMPNNEEDFDMVTTVFADFDASYMGGAVRETDENDNIAAEHCRIAQAGPGNEAPPPYPPNGNC